MDNETQSKSLIVMPTVTPAQAKESWQAYQDLKKVVIEDDDIAMIKNKPYLKKSYCQ